MDESKWKIKKRKREQAEVRQVAQYFGKKYKEKTGLSLQEIGDMTGFRHHATVLNSYRTVCNMIETDKHFRGKIERINDRLNNLIN